MFDWWKRRRLTEDARRRLVVSLAKAEEAVIETHVRSALEVIAAVGGELPLDRVLELYLEALDPGDGKSEIVARRVLSRLEGDDDMEDEVESRRRR